MIKRILGDIIRLFYPAICPGCGQPLLKNENVLCLGCEIKLPRTGFLIHPENPVEKIFWGRLPLNHASAFLYFRKSGLAQNLMHRLKYKNHRELGIRLGYMAGIEYRDVLKTMAIDALTVVPLHSKKLKTRGYNQSQLVAEGFSLATGIPLLTGVLVRQHASETQTKKKRYERWENIENLFDVADTGSVAGKHILLIDDVITTGATIEACGKALVAVPDTRLSVLGLCLSVH